MTVANDPEHVAWDDTWTFQSSLGAWRQIDFIFLSPGLRPMCSSAVDTLCLGSDHRPVHARISFACRRRRGDPHSSQRNQRPKSWQPAAGYAQHILQTIRERGPKTVAEVEKVVTDVANMKNAVHAQHSAPKFTDRLIRWRHERTLCRNKEARTTLSKRI